MQTFRRFFSTVKTGAKYTESFKAYALDANNKPCSFFHDIPLTLDVEAQTAKVVIEIPRNSQAKFEINKSEPLNPIKQDIKKSKPRFVNNVFPFNGYPCNYGAFPQTWEDPAHIEHTFSGDNDPVDIVELGGARGEVGEVKDVKILGALAMIDDGEMDWKILTIDLKDPLAAKVTDLFDIQSQMPGFLPELRKWFRDYKCPQDKPKNKFAYLGRYLSAKQATEVVAKHHELWKALVKGKATGEKLPVITNTSLDGTPGYDVSSSELQLSKEEPAAPIAKDNDTIYYYK